MLSNYSPAPWFEYSSRKIINSIHFNKTHWTDTVSLLHGILHSIFSQYLWLMFAPQIRFAHFFGCFWYFIFFFAASSFGFLLLHYILYDLCSCLRKCLLPHRACFSFRWQFPCKSNCHFTNLIHFHFSSAFSTFFALFISVFFSHFCSLCLQLPMKFSILMFSLQVYCLGGCSPTCNCKRQTGTQQVCWLRPFPSIFCCCRDCNQKQTIIKISAWGSSAYKCF